MNYDSLLASGLVPDSVTRWKIRSLLAERLKEEDRGGLEADHKHMMALIAELKSSPIAVQTAAANEQHYEVPTEFFKYCLGKHMKYSCGYWKNDNVSFDQSQADMLDITTERAEIKDGMKVLELGCGWGSLTLFMAAKYPKSEITGVSNSRTQKEYIDEEARKRGLVNVRIITADMNSFDIQEQFDRVVSVEMFEHMRNYQMLMHKVSTWLKDDGKLFVHIFTHKYYSYKFEVKDDTDWMSKYFFTGGIMPGDQLLLYFQDHMAIDQHWRVNGQHYEKTSNAWLAEMDKHKNEIMPIFEKVYGEKKNLWWAYWRIFYMACAELWGYKGGREWFVSHYLFKKR